MPILTGCGRRVRCLLSMCWKTRCFCEVSYNYKYLVVVLPPVTDADYQSQRKLAKTLGLIHDLFGVNGKWITK